MKIYGSRDSFYQWDVNQKITSAKLREGDEVHFANDRSGEAIVVKAYKHNHVVVADVPNILLQQTNKILVYRYVTDGVSELTVCEKSFDVLARPKPTDYIYTETDCITVQDFVFKALEEAKENGDFNGEDGMGISSITANEAGKLVITLETGESVVIDIPTVRGEDGTDGEDGKDGVDGRDGADGSDGISPIITTATIENGHRITITDAGGAHSIDLFNGKDGQNGIDGKDGKDGTNGKDGHTPQRGVDYYTEADKSDMIQAVLSALPDNREVAY